MAPIPIQQQQSLLVHPCSSSAKKPTYCTQTTTIYTSISLLALFICTISLFSDVIPYHHDHNRSSLPFKVCSHAHNPDSCLALVTQLREGRAGNINEVDLLKLFLNNSISRIADVINLTNSVSIRVNDLRQKSALADCMELMNSSIDRILDSMSAISSKTKQQHLDAQTWLSSVLTNIVTCSDGLNGSLPLELISQLEDLTTRASSSLAILTAITSSSDPSEDMITKPLNGEYPSWITSRERKLLQFTPEEDPSMNADAVVAEDGSGNYTTVTEAVAAAPKKSKCRYVIYVKQGTYKENVVIPKNKKNLMLTGDGMDLTIITGSLNVVDGSTTFKSATLSKQSFCNSK